MTDNSSNKVIAAEFPLGSSSHFNYEKLLAKNKIEFETLTRTEYGDASGFDIISFLVEISEEKNAKELATNVKAEHESRKVAPINKKYYKIFFIGMLLIAL